MSDQQQAAPQGGEGQSAVQQQQPQQPPEITEAYLNELREQGKHDELRKAVETLERQAQGEPVPQPDAGTPPDGQQQQPPPQQEEKKSFDIKFRGQDVSFRDEDGYLGAGDFGKMKKELAHNRAKLGDVETQLSRNTSMYNEQVQKLRSLNEQKEAAEEKVKGLQARVSELEKSLQAAPQQSATPQFEIPEPPVRPDYDPDEYMSEELKKQVKDYEKARADYDKKINLLLRDVATGKFDKPQQPQKPTQSTPPATSSPTAQLPDDVKELVEWAKTQRAQQADTAQQGRQKAYWDSFRDFQGKHKEFATPIDVEELNNQVLGWMNKLAYANGFDLKPGASQEEKANYERAKRQLAYKYASGDAQVLANSEGCPAPQGYDVYVKLANLDKVRKDLISRGILGQQAGLQEAWLNHYSGTDMNQDISNLETAAANRGASNVINQMQNQQQTYARNIPNNAAGGAGAPSAPMQPGQISSDEVQALLNASPIELAANPQLAARRRDVLQILNEARGVER